MGRLSISHRSDWTWTNYWFPEVFIAIKRPIVARSSRRIPLSLFFPIQSIWLSWKYLFLIEKTVNLFRCRVRGWPSKDGCGSWWPVSLRGAEARRSFYDRMWRVQTLVSWPVSYPLLFSLSFCTLRKFAEERKTRFKMMNFLYFCSGAAEFRSIDLISSTCSTAASAGWKLALQFVSFLIRARFNLENVH